MVSTHLAKAMTRLAVLMPFEEVRKVLDELVRISVSVTCIEQVVVRIGERLWKKARQEAHRPYAIRQRDKGVKLLYVCADGAMVPLVGNGHVEYKENKLGVVFNDRDMVQKRGKNGETTTRIVRKRLVSSLAEGVEPFKKLLYAAAVKKGYHQAKTVVFLSDGASWLWKCKDDYFPKAVRILDWYHAVEHLWATARAVWGEENEGACRAWVAPLEKLLWEGKVDEVIRRLEEEIRVRRTKQQPFIELRGYYYSNRESMRYDEYRRRGWYFGSGPVESANKYIVNQRLKRSGMKWTTPVANAVLWARCKYCECEKEWNTFWDTMSLPEYLNHTQRCEPKAA